MAIRYWEDYSVGEVIHSSGRTMDNADIRMFLGATDASHPAHVDVEYAKRHPFGKLVVPGSLIVGIIDGFAIEVLNGKSVKMAHYGYDRVRFIKPVGVGSTISMTATVEDKREKSAEFGLLTLRYEIFDESGDLVAVMTDLQLMERRASSGDGSAAAE